MMNALLDRRRSLPDLRLWQQPQQPREEQPMKQVEPHRDEADNVKSDNGSGDDEHDTAAGSDDMPQAPCHRRRHSSYEDYCKNNLDRVNNESYHVPSTTKLDICSSNFSTLSLLMELEETTTCPATTKNATAWDTDVHFHPHDLHDSSCHLISVTSSCNTTPTRVLPSPMKQKLHQARMDIGKDAERDRVKTRIACPHYRRWYYQQTHIAQPLRESMTDLDLVEAMVAVDLLQQQQQQQQPPEHANNTTTNNHAMMMDSSCSSLFSVPTLANPTARNSFHDHHRRMTMPRIQPNPHGVLFVELDDEEEEDEEQDMNQSMSSLTASMNQSNHKARNNTAVGSLLSILHHVPQRPDITSLVIDTSRQTLTAASVLLILQALLQCLSPDAAPRVWGSIELRLVFDDHATTTTTNYHKWYRTIQCSLSDVMDVAQLINVAMSLDIARWTVTPYSGTYRYVIASRTTSQWQYYEQLQQQEQEQEQQEASTTTCGGLLYDESARGSVATCTTALSSEDSYCPTR